MARLQESTAFTNSLRDKHRQRKQTMQHTHTHTHPPTSTFEAFKHLLRYDIGEINEGSCPKEIFYDALRTWPTDWYCVRSSIPG